MSRVSYTAPTGETGYIDSRQVFFQAGGTGAGTVWIKGRGDELYQASAAQITGLGSITGWDTAKTACESITDVDDPTTDAS